MIKKPRLNLVNRGGGIRANKPAAAPIRKPDHLGGVPGVQQRYLEDPPLSEPHVPDRVIPDKVSPVTPVSPPHTAESVGKLLAEARKGQGKSIHELSEITHIRDLHLQALESGAIDRLPGITFVAGFMRLYARHLNIEDTDPIESFLETLDQKRQGLQMEHFPAPTKASHRPNVSLILLGIIVLLAGFIGYERYFSPLAPTPAIPAAAPLRVESSSQEGDVFVEDAATADVVREESAPATVNVAPVEEAKVPVVAAKPVPPSSGDGEAKTEPQSSVRSFFSFWDQAADAMKPKAEPEVVPKADVSQESSIPPEGDEGLATDVGPTGMGEEEDTPGDFDNAALQSATTPDGGLAASRSTQQWPEAPSTSAPASVSAPAPASATTTPASVPTSDNTEAVVTTPGAAESSMAPIAASPALPEVSPRPRLPRSDAGLPPVETLVVSPSGSQEIAPAIPSVPVVSVPASSAVPEVAPEVAPPPQEASVPAPVPPSGNPKNTARERVIDAHPVPVYSDSAGQTPDPGAIALVAKELVWIQIQDKDGLVLKDMVMQPGHVFHIPEGETFYAILGNASSVQVRVGDKTLPFLGEAGEVIQDLELSPDALKKRVQGL
ncbi:MAG: DUF4115 domain-containing protein [Magnetococcus sp. THC-1_WYH]